MTEPAAAAKTDDGPLREYQIDLPVVIRESLKQKNYENLLLIGDPKLTAGTVSAKPYRSRTGGDAELDRLIVAIDSTGDKSIRNTVLAQLVAASTTNCSIYLQSLRGGQVTARLTSDIAATAFGLAGGLAEPVRSARILSNLSAFSTSTGASIDRSIFAQQGAELVADAIVQLREKDRLYLEGRMSEDMDAWPMGLALADFARFHGDCSMLRGLSQMREAVVAREQQVQAARASALAVAQSGGDGKEVAAAVAGVVDGYGDIRLASYDITPSARVTNGSLRQDLESQKALAMACFDKALGKFSGTMSMNKLPDTDKCAPSEPKWKDRYSAQADTALSALTFGDIDSKERTAIDLKEAESMSEKAKKDSPNDKKALEDAAVGLEEARQKRFAHAETIIKSAQSQVRAAIDIDIGRIASARSIAVAALDGLTAERPAADAKPLVEAAAGADLKTKDPAFVLALQAIDNVSGANGNALQAASIAKAAIRSVASTPL
ncbi:hypothetical protein DDF62_20845 [Caulobacter radicis]|nr:hypothetical protein DDF62_20845 [Caulobacter radicis]